ncbi:MAG: hypothetical protein ACI4P7_00870 [Bacilli bacterium]
MRKKRFILIGCIIFAVFFIGCSYYQDRHSVTKVVSYNGNDLRISIDGVSADTLPASGDYYLANYDCKSANTILTWDRVNYQLKVSNGNKKGGVSCYLDFQTNPKLSDMEVGSYVSYTGNNGCSGVACGGQNANYVSDTDMGYCYSSNYKFIVNGWRVGYVKDGSVYLISAGSPECMCTNSDGTSSNSSCSDSESTGGVPMHLANLDNKALTYCNTNYAYGGICNSSSAWAMDADDFQIITGSVLSSSSCYNQYSSVVCGYQNDLIDNGGYYWYATPYSASSSNAFDWRPNYRNVSSNYSYYVRGVRPVLRLESSVLVVGGSGTYEDPYQIGNNTFWINNGATTVSNANKSSVSLTLMTVNATQMCISTNTSVCTNYVDFSTSYTLDWSNEAAGEKVVYVYYKNSFGIVVASMNRSITLLAS